MIAYVIRRLLGSIVVLFGVSLIVFVLLFVVGDPALALLPPEASQAQLEAFRHAMGFDRPVLVQYLDFLRQAVRGDFGQSLWYKQPAGPLALQRLPATFELAFSGLSIALVLAISLGVLAAARRGSWIDRIATVLAALGQSMPIYFLGLLLVLLLTVTWHLLPSSGRGTLAQLVMPALTLGLYSTARIMRLTRSGMIEVLSQEYIRTARSKGLSNRAVVYRHGLRNALLPVVTYVGLEVGHLLGGTVITETIFAWPGIGRLAIEAITYHDYVLLEAVVVIVAAIFVLVNLGVDLLYPVLDPRIRLGRSNG